MSSLAATQADGYYAPPEYYESGAYKKKSVSQFNEKSKGHNQYLQKGIVRFELPYDGFCKACGEHVGKGTRFNAKKVKAGAYFSSPIYKFTMTCRACRQSEFVIQTNPKEQSFDYLEGIHKQVQEFDTKEAGTAGVIDTEYGNKLVPASGSHVESSALSRLESVACGARKTMTDRDELESLINVNNKTFFNDADSNATIRSAFRDDRKKKKKRRSDAKALGWKEGMELAEEADDDLASARATCFGKGKDTEKKRFRTLRTSSIFDHGNRKRKSRRHGGDCVRPDEVNSHSSSTRIARVSDSVQATPIIKQEDCGSEKKRIRIVSSGAKLERRNEVPIVPPSSKEKKDSSVIAMLLADYGSDSD